MTFWFTRTTATDRITSVQARVVKDSRQRPTIAVTVQAGEHQGIFSVPSGASTGDREVVALPARDAVRIVQQVIAPQICGQVVTDQARIDAILHQLDESPQFATLGGNTALGVSVAACKAAAAATNTPLWQYLATYFAAPGQASAPRLFVNLINGGAHADRGSQIQEHQIIPETDNVHEAFRVTCAVQRTLRDVLRTTFDDTDVGIGDEGGFMIPSQTLIEPFELLAHAIALTETSCPISLGTDVAASSFATPAGYTLAGETYDGPGLVRVLTQLRATVPSLQYVEDPADEDDRDSFAAFLANNPGCTVIGDDLTTTACTSVVAAAEAQAISGVIIKPNQIGTVSDTLQTMRAAYARNVRCIVSHRSGETDDTFIADLAFGTKAFGLKAGAPTATERLVKYQRLLTIAS